MLEFEFFLLKFIHMIVFWNYHQKKVSFVFLFWFWVHVYSYCYFITFVFCVTFSDLYLFTFSFFLLFRKEIHLFTSLPLSLKKCSFFFEKKVFHTFSFFSFISVTTRKPFTLWLLSFLLLPFYLLLLRLTLPFMPLPLLFIFHVLALLLFFGGFFVCLVVFASSFWTKIFELKKRSVFWLLCCLPFCFCSFLQLFLFVFVLWCPNVLAFWLGLHFCAFSNYSSFFPFIPLCSLFFFHSFFILLHCCTLDFLFFQHFWPSLSSPLSSLLSSCSILSFCFISPFLFISFSFVDNYCIFLFVVLSSVFILCSFFDVSSFSFRYLFLIILFHLFTSFVLCLFKLCFLFSPSCWSNVVASFRKKEIVFVFSFLSSQFYFFTSLIFASLCLSFLPLYLFLMFFIFTSVILEFFFLKKKTFARCLQFLNMFSCSFSLFWYLFLFLNYFIKKFLLFHSFLLFILYLVLFWSYSLFTLFSTHLAKKRIFWFSSLSFFISFTSFVSFTLSLSHLSIYLLYTFFISIFAFHCSLLFTSKIFHRNTLLPLDLFTFSLLSFITLIITFVFLKKKITRSAFHLVYLFKMHFLFFFYFFQFWPFDLRYLFVLPLFLTFSFRPLLHCFSCLFFSLFIFLFFFETIKNTCFHVLAFIFEKKIMFNLQNTFYFIFSKMEFFSLFYSKLVSFEPCCFFHFTLV